MSGYWKARFRIIVTNGLRLGMQAQMTAIFGSRVDQVPKLTLSPLRYCQRSVTSMYKFLYSLVIREQGFLESTHR